MLQMLDFAQTPDGVWIMVRCKDAKGAVYDGWVPQQRQYGLFCPPARGERDVLAPRGSRAGDRRYDS